MDGDSIGKIILLAVLLVFSAFFSASETSFSTFNRIKMKSLAQGGNKRAKLVMKYEEKYDKFLNSVLIGNNIVNIALSSIATIFFVDLFKGYAEDAQSLGATVSTVVATVAVLIFGEITPKVIAKAHADKIAMAFVMVIHFIIIILTPLSLIFTGWTKLIMKLFKQSEDVVTEEELITIVDEAEEDGTIESDEGDLIRSAIEFNDVSAGDILTPRVDIVAISKDSTMEEIAESFTKGAYSRLPMYGEDLDDIVGILHEKDFFVAYHGKKDSVSEYIHKPEYVSEHIKIADLLQVLKTKKTHMAIVVDEFGGTMGIVTMEDIIEQLIGDVFDEHDEIENDNYQELPDGSFIVKCSADLDDFFDKFDIIVDDEEDMPQTVNGFIQKELESIPHVGDGFDYKNLKIEISNIGPKRVEEIHVTVIENEEEDAE